MHRRTPDDPRQCGPATPRGAVYPRRRCRRRGRIATPTPVVSAAVCAARSAHHALAVAPRSSATPLGIRTQPPVRSTWTRCQAGTRRTRSCNAGPRRKTSAKSRSYPMSHIMRPTVGSTRPSVECAASIATSSASSSTSDTATHSPARWLTRARSESSRNRLHAASTSAITRSQATRASGSAEECETSTTAVVPSAANLL